MVQIEMNNQPNFALFEQLEITPGRLDKQALLATATDADKQFLKLALDPDMTYKLQKIDTPMTEWAPLFDLSLYGFTQMCNWLNSKKALTNDDRCQVGNWLGWFYDFPDRAKWYERALLKDLGCDFGASTTNKVWPDLIPTYDCALADEYDLEKDETRLKNSFIDVKLDGFRCLAIVKTVHGDGFGAKVVHLRSRSGKHITTFPQIEEELALLPDNTYDGEVYLHGQNGFQKLMKYVKKDEPAPDDVPFRYYIFDIVSEKHFPQRHNEIVECFLHNDDPEFLVWPAHGNMVCNVGERLGFPYLFEAINTEGLTDLVDQALAAGFEGVMVKDKGTAYKPKRSKNILKVKRFYSAEFKVVGSYIGKKGRNENRLGGVNVISEKEITVTLKDGKTWTIPAGIEFNVGGGFTDAMRQDFWDDRDSLVGRIAEVKFQELSEDKIPRFGVFKRFREDLEIGL